MDFGNVNSNLFGPEIPPIGAGGSKTEKPDRKEGPREKDFGEVDPSIFDKFRKAKKIDSQESQTALAKMEKQFAANTVGFKEEEPKENETEKPPLEAEVASAPDVEKLLKNFKEAQGKAEGEPLNLEKAREKYLLAKKNFEGYSRVLKLDVKGENKIKVLAELKTAEAEYKKRRAEFVGSNVEKFIVEKNRLLEERLKIYAGEKSRAGKFLDWYKSLGKYNLDSLISFKEKSVAQKIARRINIRTAVSLGLFGVGLTAGAAMPGLAAGAFIARRFVGGLGTGVGAFETAKSLREWRMRKKAEHPSIDLKDFSKKERDEYLDKTVAAGLLDGQSLEQLFKNEFLSKLFQERQLQLIHTAEQEGSQGKILERLAEKEEEKIDKALKKEKQWRRKLGVLSAAAGAVVSSGLLRKAVGELGAEKSDAGVVKAATTHEASAIPRTGGTTPLETGKTAEVGKEFVVPVSSRGIEGTILDLESKDPERYHKIIGWMKENYNSEAPGGNSDDKLVHRFVLSQAREHGWKAADLDRIANGELKFGPGGQVELGENLEFSQASEAAAGKSASVIETKNAALEPPKNIASAEVPAEKPAVIAAQEAVITPGKISGKVQEMLGQSTREFFKLLELSPDSLDKIQSKTMGEFVGDYARQNIEYQKSYGGLKKAIEIHIKRIGWSKEFLSQTKVADFVYELAKAQK